MSLGDGLTPAQAADLLEQRAAQHRQENEADRTGSELMTLEVGTSKGARVFRDWTRGSVVRSLHELAGSFAFDFSDEARMRRLLPRSSEAGDVTRIVAGQPCVVRIGADPVLLGRIDSVEWKIQDDQVVARLTGRDQGGDLVDCTANPRGPVQYRGLTALQIARELVRPFDMEVRAEAPVGDPIPDFQLDASETVASALDKLARQRALVVTSDGIGNLLLTRSGAGRASAELALPGNVLVAAHQDDWRQRYADYYVKGQSSGAGGRRGRRGGRRAALDSTVPAADARPPAGGGTAAHARGRGATGPLDSTVPAVDAPLDGPYQRPGSPRQVERATVVQSGHAHDPDLNRYRPRVFLSRTHSGGAPAQVLAEWRMRIARGQSVKHSYVVAGWRAGSGNRLWRPNELVAVRLGEQDPYDLLVEGVTFTLGEDGARTELRCVGREAYDMEPLPAGRRRHGAGGDVARGAPGSGRVSGGGNR